MNDLTNFLEIGQRIIGSNTIAAKNRNLYPIQEQATLLEVWKLVPCTCDSNCTCKKFGCEHHWVLKDNLMFEEILPAYLRMFVDKRLHRRILGWINGAIDFPNKIPSRGAGALSVLTGMKENFNEIYPQSLGHNKTLICDNWYNEFFRDRWNFSIRGKSIHEAKQFCLLLPDVCVPYDTGSRSEILKFFDANSLTYYGMLKNLREWVIKVMKHENKKLCDLRRLDSPQKQLPFSQDSISLKRDSFDYGNSYNPSERPISRVIDKVFYKPTTTETDKYKCAQADVISNGQELYPLSGKGQRIRWRDTKKSRIVEWGDTKFILSDELFDDVLDDYFKDTEKWYPLGASMTDPVHGGLGEYIQNNFPPLTPRHVSAIAAIMVQEGLIEFRGKKPIELRKLVYDGTNENESN
jgi:hypothetical protein